MAIPFSGIITPSSIVFTTVGGKIINVTNAHINFDTIKSVLKEVQQYINSGASDGDVTMMRRKLDALADVSRTITKAAQATNGKVTVVDGVVVYDGTPLHNTIALRILDGLKDGFDMKPYMLFIENLMKNPSKRAVDELYGFIENSTMGITDDGMIAAYKRVRNDYTDCHSGKFDNSIGVVLEMARNAVDDDSTRTCSYGFHFCSFSYLAHFGSAGRGDRVMIVKVNPADVVSIPKDYNDAKARCCRYEVIGEYEGDDKEDILGTRGVWSGDLDWQRELPRNELDIYDSIEGGYASEWSSSSEWVSSAEEEPVEDEQSILAQRVDDGDAITNAEYTYRRSDGAFVKVVLTIENTAQYAIYDESMLSEVDCLIASSAESTGYNTKIRMFLVP